MVPKSKEKIGKTLEWLSDAIKLVEKHMLSHTPTSSQSDG